MPQLELEGGTGPVAVPAPWLFVQCPSGHSPRLPQLCQPSSCASPASSALEAPWQAVGTWPLQLPHPALPGRCQSLVLCCVSSGLPAEPLTRGEVHSSCSRVGTVQGWLPAAGRALGTAASAQGAEGSKVSCGHRGGERSSGDRKPFLVQVAYNTETSEFHS